MSKEFCKLQNFWLYETKTIFYLVGYNETQTEFRILKIKRVGDKPNSLLEILFEDPIIYSAEEIVEILDMINDGNKSSGGLVKICTAFGIVGFVKFLNGYYLTLITQIKPVGNIAGNIIYTIKGTEMFSLKPKEEKESNAFKAMWKKLNKKLSQTTSEIAENRYLGLFQFIDMTKDFFFSYSYDITHSFQTNYVLHKHGNSNFSKPQEIFEWNYYQTEEFRQALGEGSATSLWVLPIIHGSYQQKRFSIFGQNVDLIVLARRSRHYAGTRYLKRGINVHGKVANDCEVEQILQYNAGYEPKFCSYIQMRGSIPTYWYQETSVTMPKPPILLNRVDPDYLATQDHFADMFRRYSYPIIILDLVKQHEKRPRETIVGKEFKQAVQIVNETIDFDHKIRYVALDHSKISAISKGKLSKSKSKPSTSTNVKSSNFDEWMSVEKSNKDNKPAEDPLNTPMKLVNFDETKKDFLLSPTSTTNDISSLTTGILDNIIELQAVESKLDILKELEDIAHLSLQETGFFCSSLQHLPKILGYLPSSQHTKVLSYVDSSLPYHLHHQLISEEDYILQSGVLRTNCIDCLDRTNGGQFAVAIRFLLLSLKAVGIINEKHSFYDISQDSIFLSLMEMYAEMGDKIALQYGGSEAHNKGLTTTSSHANNTSGTTTSQESVQTNNNSKALSVNNSKQSELLTSIKRYYSNAFTDMVKQDAMNIFLGCFIPNENTVPLWDLESDYNLHNLALHPSYPRLYNILYHSLREQSLQFKQLECLQYIESQIMKLFIQLLSDNSVATSSEDNTSTNNDTNTDDSTTSASITIHIKESLLNDLRTIVSAKDQHAINSSNSPSSKTIPMKHKLNEYLIQEIKQLLTRYYIQFPSITNRTLLQTIIHHLTRLERRKCVRIISDAQIAKTSSSWWQEALCYHYSRLYPTGYPPKPQHLVTEGEHQPFRRPLLTNSLINKFENVYQVNEISEFDRLLEIDYVTPIEINQRIVMNVRTAAVEGEEEGEDGLRADSIDDKITNNAILTMFSFYPTLFTQNNTQTSPMSPNKALQDKETIDSYPQSASTSSKQVTPVPSTTGFYSEKNNIPLFNTFNDDLMTNSNNEGDSQSSPAPNNNNSTSSGFQITKYFQQIGSKARNIMGGFLKKEETTPLPSQTIPSMQANIQRSETILPLKTRFHINDLQHTILKPSMNLYTQYVSQYTNPWLLYQDPHIELKQNDFEYKGLLKETLISVDDVKGMENLASDSYIHHEINRGMFIGLPQQTSSLLTYQILFLSLIFVESDLLHYGECMSESTLQQQAQSGWFTGNTTPQPTPNTTGGLTSSQALNKLQGHIMKYIQLNKHLIIHGIEIEFKKLINNYIFQQYVYVKEIDHERITRRLSTLANEKSIYDYCMQFSTQFIASNWQEIEYIIHSIPSYTNFNELLQLNKQLSYDQQLIKQRKQKRLKRLKAKEMCGMFLQPPSKQTISTTSTASASKSTFTPSNKENQLPSMSHHKPLRPSTTSSLPHIPKEHEENMSISSSLGLYIPGLEDDLLMNMSQLEVITAQDIDTSLFPISTIIPDRAHNLKKARSRSFKGLDTNIDIYSPEIYNFLNLSHDPSATSSVTKTNTNNSLSNPSVMSLTQADSSFGLQGYPAYPYSQSTNCTKIHWENEYVGFTQLAPDLYTKVSNPHMQLNEISVLKYSELLDINNQQTLVM